MRLKRTEEGAYEHVQALRELFGLDPALETEVPVNAEVTELAERRRAGSRRRASR